MRKIWTLLAGTALVIAGCGGSDGSAPSADDEAVTVAGETIDAPPSEPIPEPTDPPVTGAPTGDDDGFLNVPATRGRRARRRVRTRQRQPRPRCQGCRRREPATQNYTDNGVFFTGAEDYRVSYVTAYRNGDYGIYAFDSVKGQIEHSYGAGSTDAGFYIGQCYPCDAVVDDVLAEHNGLGYSGTNAGGDLAIVNSTFRNNRAGIVPNSGSYELCYPQRENLIVGNTVHSNNQPDTSAIDVAMGNGILVAGGIGNTIERNLVYDHDRTGIALTPFLEETPNDDLPTRDEWDVSSVEQRDEPLVDEWLAACDGEALSADDPAWNVEALDVLAWLGEVESQPPPVDYEIAERPPIPDLDDMPDAATAPARPATDVPFAVDTDAIVVP